MGKKPKSTPGPAPEAEFTLAVERLTEALSVIEDTLSQIKGEIAWIINNRHDLRPPVPVITRMPKQASDPNWGAKLAAINKPETIACYECEAPSPNSLAFAIDQGWAELTPEDGDDCNYRGLCPGCFEREYGIPPNVRAPKPADKPPHQGGEQTRATTKLVEPPAENAESPKPQDTLFG